MALMAKKIYMTTLHDGHQPKESELQTETVCIFLEELKRSDPIFFEIAFPSS
jgi:hypothetical protein